MIHTFISLDDLHQNLKLRGINQQQKDTPPLPLEKMTETNLKQGYVNLYLH